VTLLKQSAPLAGKRVVITRSSLTARGLEKLLTAAGAITIGAPMIRVEYPQDCTEIDAAIRNLASYDWTVFTSVHSVRGFCNRLAPLGEAAPSRDGGNVAAIGPITARALRKRGITPRLVPEPYSFARLINGVLAETAGRPSRILWVRGHRAAAGLPEALRNNGITLNEVAVYYLVGLTPPEPVLSAIRGGVDAVLLCSPAAARQFARLRLDVGNALLACIGPSTAAAALESGVRVDIVARQCTDEGLVAALARAECENRNAEG